jgi:ATP-binding cassette, subfamily G (WHITE), eye pigment precursor transporter
LVDIDVKGPSPVKHTSKWRYRDNFFIDTKVKLTFSNIIYEVKIKCSKQEAELTGQNHIT